MCQLVLGKYHYPKPYYPARDRSHRFVVAVVLRFLLLLMQTVAECVSC